MLTLLENLPKLLRLIGGAQSGLVLLQPLVETLPDRQKDEARQSYLMTIQTIFISMCTQIVYLSKYATEDLQQQWKVLLSKIIDESKDLSVKKKAITLLPEMIKLGSSRQELIIPITLISELKEKVPENLRCNFLCLLPSILAKK